MLIANYCSVITLTYFSEITKRYKMIFIIYYSILRTYSIFILKNKESFITFKTPYYSSTGSSPHLCRYPFFFRSYFRLLVGVSEFVIQSYINVTLMWCYNVSNSMPTMSITTPPLVSANILFVTILIKIRSVLWIVSKKTVWLRCSRCQYFTILVRLILLSPSNSG